MHVLVAYGSRYGSTKDTARDIARHLEQAGHDVEVADAADVDALANYDLAIIGSGIYAGLLRRRVVRLLHRIARQRPSLPVAVFAMGPLAPEQDTPDAWRSTRERVARAIDRVDDLHVVDTEVFGGVIEPERMNWMFARMGAIDLRDQRAVERWVDEVLASVRVPVA